MTEASGGGTAPDDRGDAVPPTAEVLRSEEQIVVSLPVRVRGGMRISKTISTGTVTQTVEIRREQLRVEELSADDLTLTTSNDLADYDLAEHEFDLVLHEERVVITTEMVPVEHVRVRTRVITEQVDVSDTVQREQVQVDTIPETPPTE